MPVIIIDEREIEVPEGTKVIEAAEQLGIVIPRFCYHPALGSVGACRVCAVKFLEGPFKGVQMSCMIDAKDGMVVSTTDEEVVDFRKHVIEWLMLNHPHDCPVCDEGGQCLLQDMTVSGGHGMRRYLGAKRTYQDQYLGPLVQHEMNRCIHCYRCSRFYQEFTGYLDLGPMQSGNRTYFGRYKEGILESPFAGNLNDLCPTGVYTDKPSRFKGRRWDFQRTPSLCINCSLGCHTTSNARYREVVRQEARFSEPVNGHFICDRGRYGFFYASHEERPRQTKIHGEPVPYEEGIRTVKERLGQMGEAPGPEAVACVGSARSSLETQAMLKRVCRINGWDDPVYFMEETVASTAAKVLSRLEGGLTVSLRQVEGADFILAIGADPINEAPMLALAMRQAQRKGARVVVIDPRPIALPFEFQHLPVGPGQINLALGSIIKTAVDMEMAKELGQAAVEFCQAIPGAEVSALSVEKQIAQTAVDIQRSQRPVIVCGTDIVGQATVALAADQTLLLQAMDKEAGLFYLMPGANGFGAALLSDTRRSLEQVVASIEDGTVRGLILVESNPFWGFHDGQRLDQALDKLDFLVVLDYVNSRAVQKADVFLPATTIYEEGGVFINQEGRIQQAPVGYSGGLPIAQITGGDHPPRVFRSDIPGDEPRAAWQSLAELARGESGLDKAVLRENLWTWLADGHPLFRGLPPMDQLPDDGVRLKLGKNSHSHFTIDWPVELKNGINSADALKLILVDWTFATEELSLYSAPLARVEKSPSLAIHSDDAAKLGLRDGDAVTVKLDRGSLEVKVGLVENMARGVMILPRHRLLEWQRIEALPKMVSFEDIKKTSV